MVGQGRQTKGVGQEDRADVNHRLTHTHTLSHTHTQVCEAIGEHEFFIAKRHANQPAGAAAVGGAPE